MKTALKVCGVALLLWGGLALAYFFISFEVTTDNLVNDTHYGHRREKVVNLELLNKRECGVTASAALFLAGAMFLGCGVAASALSPVRAPAAVSEQDAFAASPPPVDYGLTPPIEPAIKRSGMFEVKRASNGAIERLSVDQIDAMLHFSSLRATDSFRRESTDPWRSLKEWCTG